MMERGFRFQKEGADNWRDVWYAGDCDAGCRALAKELGWETELEDLVVCKGAKPAAMAAWLMEDEGGETA